MLCGGADPISIYGLHGVVLAHVFFNMPLAVRLLLQGWAEIPAERFRTAALLGFQSREMFRLIEWPMLTKRVPGVFAVIFAICLTSFAVALTLGGGPRATTIELAIYQAFRFDFDLARAAVLSALQVIIAGTAAFVAASAFTSTMSQGGFDRPVQRWDAPSPVQDVLWLGLATVFLVCPLLAVVQAGLPALTGLPPSVWAAAWSSVQVAACSVVIVIALALPLAAWIGTTGSRFADALTLIGLAASPLMIGTGWFILINPYMAPQSLALPVTAFVNALMSLPFVLRALTPSLRQAVTDHTRLAQSLGMTRASFWRWVVWPRIKAPLGFGLGLTAALSVGDLGVVTLFADTSTATLPLQMYRLMGAYRMEDAAGAALLLLCLALALFVMFDRWGRGRARV